MRRVLALYFVDWDRSTPRSAQVDIKDTATGTVLDTRSISSFQDGKYLVWDIAGNVTVHITNVDTKKGVTSKHLTIAFPL